MIGIVHQSFDVLHPQTSMDTRLQSGINRTGTVVSCEESESLLGPSPDPSTVLSLRSVPYCRNFSLLAAGVVVDSIRRTSSLRF